MKILLVEDDASTRRGIAAFLSSLKHEVHQANHGGEALKCLSRQTVELVISDVMMKPMDGVTLLQEIQQLPSPPPVMMMTAFSGMDEAIKAVRHGAEDYLTKPLNLDELEIKLERIEHKVELKRENQSLKQSLAMSGTSGMIGVSLAMREIHMSLERLTRDSDVSVMIHGQSGTGKELVARTIHAMSARSRGPFVAVNCAAFPENLLESELFGYRRGAFTGAVQDKTGLMAEAHKGTLFLDEVSEMSPSMQGRLLRALQERMIQPIGASRPLPVDVRFLGASNQDLPDLVKKGAFREDLFYRLQVVEVRVPPLRQRLEDIPLLIQHFIQKHGARRKKPLLFSHPAMEACLKHTWPGNVRELENVIRNLLVTVDAEVVGPEHLPFSVESAPAKEPTPRKQAWSPEMDYKQALDAALADFEIAFLSHHLRRFGGNISRTADAIGLSRVAIHRKIKQYGLETGNSGSNPTKPTE